MVTATLKDATPTTTITFHGFPTIQRILTAENFNSFAYPENEGAEVVFVGQWYRVFKIEFQLKDDSDYPGAGKSAADKRADLETLIFSGGDTIGTATEWLFTLTFDSEDSVPGSPQTESYTGKVKNLNIISKAGINQVITGNFEFWEADA